MKKLSYLIVLALILGLILTGCFLSNVGQIPTSEQSGITYLTKNGSLFTVGNDATLRSISDTRANFTIIDTNHPSSEFGALNTFSYYAANVNPFRFVLVDGSDLVMWVSEEITPPGIGTQSWPSLTPVPVEPGWNLGLYFALTGTVPFKYEGEPAWYGKGGAGVPAVGGTLFPYDGSSNRIYSFVATGTVRYDWTGFFPPVYDEEGVLNAAKAGRTIPVKFSLDGYQGLEDDIFPLDYPKSVRVYCDGTTDPIFTIEGIDNAGGSTLNYDAGDDQYIYVWKTEKDWAGTCRKLVILLNDGTSHEAYFTFK